MKAACLNYSAVAAVDYHETAIARSCLIGVRNGGSMFVYSNELYRVVQQAVYEYGDYLDVFRVHQVSNTLPWRETLVESFSRSFRSFRNVKGWNSMRSHHLGLAHAYVGADHSKKMWIATAVVDGDGDDTRGN